MIIISHRGNLNGLNANLENSPEQIDKAISVGFKVEVDLWYKSNFFWLGHDNANHKITPKFLIKRKSKLFVHAKNQLAFHEAYKLNLNVFWHNFVLTSWGNLWAFPNKCILDNRIEVLLDIKSDTLIPSCYGICTDNPIYLNKRLGI